MRHKKIREAVHVALMVASVLTLAELLAAQDTPMGDVARQARSEKSQAAHANKVVTDEDLGPQLGPVSETDDPAQVFNKARRAWIADMPRTCHELNSNNSGPGSSVETSREIAAPDHTRIVIDRRGSNSGHSELIVIGSNMYSRNGTGPWRKDTVAGGSSETSHWLPEALIGEYTNGELKPVRRDAIGGAPTFLYETKFHPGGVAFQDRTIDFWVGANDNLLRKIETLTKQTPPGTGGIEDRETISCFYGPMPEIKPPI